MATAVAKYICHRCDRRWTVDVEVPEWQRDSVILGLPYRCDDCDPLEYLVPGNVMAVLAEANGVLT